MQQIVDKRLGQLENPGGICVQDDILWIAHGKGVAKFEILRE